MKLKITGFYYVTSGLSAALGRVSRPPIHPERCFRLRLAGDDGCFFHLGENCMHCFSTWLKSDLPPGFYLTDSIPYSPGTRAPGALEPYPSKIADNILIPYINVVKAVADEHRQSV